jgi:inner membrane transporter RhtA
VALAVAALVVAVPGAAGAAHAFAHPGTLALAVGTGLLASVVPYTLELAALRRLPPGAFGVLLSLEPAVATLVGWLLLGQRPGPLGAVAVAVVVAASAGSTLSARRPGAGDPGAGAAVPAEGAVLSVPPTIGG